jgi:hypothetical protein
MTAAAVHEEEETHAAAEEEEEEEEEDQSFVCHGFFGNLRAVSPMLAGEKIVSRFLLPLTHTAPEV